MINTFPNTRVRHVSYNYKFEYYRALDAPLRFYQNSEHM